MHSLEGGLPTIVSLALGRRTMVAALPANSDVLSKPRPHLSYANYESNRNSLRIERCLATASEAADNDNAQNPY
jgi:hypothetical protein